MINFESYDIPRIYTALAEWFTCFIYIIHLKKRFNILKTVLILFIMLVLQLSIHSLSLNLPNYLWLFGMIIAMIFMYLSIIFCCDISISDAGYCFARCFIIAEFAASLLWQIVIYSQKIGATYNLFTSTLLLLVIYFMIFITIYYFDVYKFPTNKKLGIEKNMLLNGLLVAFSTFLINNVHFFINSYFSNTVSESLLYIRTLFDFIGVLILLTQEKLRREFNIRLELESLNNALYSQYESYKISKQNLELINYKYHDLKHQIDVIRNEKNLLVKHSYLDDVINDIEKFESQYKTGNIVLDTILMSKHIYCSKNKINLTCIADGNKLDFMSAMDICAIVGNAFDNALESVMKINDIQKRLINVYIYSQNCFLIFKFENYYENNILYENNLPITSKKNFNFHGYGIKSIKQIAEKYDGDITIHTKNNWFTLCVLTHISNC